MANKFTSINQVEQLVSLRKNNEEGWEILVERHTDYFLYVFMHKESDYKYLVYSYEVDTECVYIQDQKVGTISDFLFYFCNLHIYKA